jgi:hypothetical protein
LLDRALLAPERSNDVQAAERDLPGDKWATDPWRANLTREDREHAVALQILAGIRPTLKTMSARDLVSSLKVVPQEVGGSGFPGVAYYVYLDGNQMILDEIRTRPRVQIRDLAASADTKSEVFAGAQGPGDSLAEVLTQIAQEPAMPRPSSR